MDFTLPGHLYAKSPFDIACWDIWGQSAGLSIADMLGGCYEPTPIASSISLGTPAKMLDSVQQYRDRGYFTHSVKIGGDVCLDIERIRHLQKNRKPDEIIFYDLNRSWLPAEAIMVMNQLADFSVIFEQPCETLKQCLTVRKQTTQLISIDENLFTLDDMLFIIDRRVGEIVNIKISRVGGLTKARRLRDVALKRRYKIYYHGYRRRRYRRHRNTTLCLDDSTGV